MVKKSFFLPDFYDTVRCFFSFIVVFLLPHADTPNFTKWYLKITGKAAQDVIPRDQFSWSHDENRNFRHLTITFLL